MKKMTLILIVMISFGLTVTGQNKKSYHIDFTNPKSVVNAIFYAAQTKDFAVMQQLCDPNGQGDGDTQKLCAISQIAKQVGDDDDNGDNQKKLDEFVKMFRSARINGTISYNDREGTQYARVPFLFNPSERESRNSETMELVKRNGKWYLSNF